MLKIQPIDFDKLNNGVWLEFEGVGFLIAQSKNMDFIEAVSSATDGEHASSRVIVKALATNIIKDWRGLTDTTNQPVEYDPIIAAHMILTIDGFRDWVMQASADTDKYLTDKALAIEKKQ